MTFLFMKGDIVRPKYIETGLGIRYSFDGNYKYGRVVSNISSNIFGFIKVKILVSDEKLPTYVYRREWIYSRNELKKLSKDELILEML